LAYIDEEYDRKQHSKTELDPMSAPEPIDEFDRLLANEDSLEKYVSLGLALEELLEKLRAKGFEAEKETLSRLLELSPARAQLLELAAERLLDSQKRQDEQAFLRDPHNLVQPFRSVLKENRDEVERLVQAALRTQAPGERSVETKFLIGFLLSAVIIGAAFIVLHRTGMLSFADQLPTMLRGAEKHELTRLVQPANTVGDFGTTASA
jgi:hypothetical protein